eukprot:CAMPEP_0197523992 /NCGR_PEP_ID=MMETSP1318-20131121/8785_1 /TAXON_ID=552666 /ORGANISM="Partenskyella glossopodia, Strain RCC365" /LENGTH=164 /DNA_ID=CAMNT_0043076833 /DNA_START=682 /DNA_END=1176 /DNA_ORIENTATION=-
MSGSVPREGIVEAAAMMLGSSAHAGADAAKASRVFLRPILSPAMPQPSLPSVLAPAIVETNRAQAAGVTISGIATIKQSLIRSLPHDIIPSPATELPVIVPNNSQNCLVFKASPAVTSSSFGSGWASAPETTSTLASFGASDAFSGASTAAAAAAAGSELDDFG